jgi:ATP-dependent exoDNAse (exonuclease V) beta subunit
MKHGSENGRDLPGNGKQDRVTMEAVKDTPERLGAVITPNHAFVSASAGTGKTHTLTMRTIYLLLTGEAEKLYSPHASRREVQKAARDSLNSLVLTTFTKKASAEMQDRVFSYLNCIASAESLEKLEAERGDRDSMFLMVLGKVLRRVPGEDFDLLRKGAQALTERAPELQISTLHSFASMLISRYPVESGIPLDARFESDDDPSGIDREARMVDIWLRRLVLDGSKEMQASLESVLSQVSLENFRSLLKDCLANNWLAETLDKFTEESPEGRISPQFCLESLRAWSETVRQGKGNLKKAEGLASELDRLIQRVEESAEGSWTGLARFIQENRIYMSAGGSKPSAAMTNVIADLPGKYRVLFSNRRDLYNAAFIESLKKDSLESWNSFRNLLQSFISRARENLIKETRLITFNDMISLAARLLSEHPEVQAREYCRLKSVLVDEFQDTDPDQLELLKNLLTCPNECSHEVLGFFVGDVKQSIYRFRSADVSGVEEFRRKYLELVKCQKPVDEFNLETSFRSDPEIINHANHLFNHLLDLERPGENLSAFHPAGNLVPEWRLIDFGEEKVKAHVQRESIAGAVLAAIREYMNEETRPESDDNRSYRDILILCRGYKELDPIIDVLKRAGVPVISSGRKTFQLNTEVVDTVNLLILLLDPLDSLSIASVMKSPMVGLSDAMIYRFFKESDPLLVFSGNESVPDFISGRALEQLERIIWLSGIWRDSRIVSTREVFEDLYSDEPFQNKDDEEEGIEASSISLDDWIKRVYEIIPVEAYHRDQDLEGIAVSRITKVLDDFIQVNLEAAAPPLVWLLGEREKAVSKPETASGFSEDVSILDESVNAVKAMTIHKSKGLEGRFVIIASWARLLREGQGIFDFYRSQDVYDFPVPGESRMKAFSFKWGSFDLESDHYQDAVARDKEMDAMESRRLAYVSATRPRNRLLMISPASFGLEKNPEMRSLIEQYLDNATANGLVKRSIWEFEDSQDVPVAETGFTDINPDSYWSLWSDRFKVMMLAEEKKIAKSGRRSPADDVSRAAGWKSDEKKTERSLEKEKRKQIGTLVHHYLELHLTEKELDREELKILASLMDPAPCGSSVVDGAGVILDRFYSGATRDERGIPLRERIGNAGIIAREFPVMLSFQGESQYRIIDLLLEEDEGITIVDFKTGAKPEFMPERYIKQQETYTRAVQQLSGDRPVRFEFWWLK